MKQRVILLVLGALLAVGAHFALAAVGGVAVHLVLAAGFVGVVLFVAALLGWAFGSERALPSAGRKLVLLGVAGGLALVLGEIGLALVQKHGPSEMKAQMPEEWVFRRIGDGADFALHGVLHKHNESGFRDDEFAPKADKTMRILVLGDSLTFGQGIEVEERYSTLIEQRLREKFACEVLNLGLCGYQSADVLEVAKTWLPKLEPDLVLYGHCLNDFLPSGVGQYANNMRWAVPLPDSWKQGFERSLVGSLLADRYNYFLMRAGIRRDFFGDILLDFDGCAARFGRDMRALNEYVTERGLPPVVGLVLNQYPANEQGRQIGKIAEDKMKAAGMVVASSAYIDEYSAKSVQLHVSQWEGHPNGRCNALFADAFLECFDGPEFRTVFARFR